VPILALRCRSKRVMVLGPRLNSTSAMAVSGIDFPLVLVTRSCSCAMSVREISVN
jgi:hypothetical protein